MNKFILISVFSFFCTAALQAQDKNSNGTDSSPASTQDTIYVDTTVYYNQLELSSDSVKEWKNQQDFAYVKHLDSLLKQQQKKIQESEKNQKNKKGQKDQQDGEEDASSGQNWFGSLLSSSIFHVFLWSIAIIFILFILYNLFLTDGAFRKRTKSANTAAPEAEEEIITSESDFVVMIKQAVLAGNYRLAIRYQYLQTLHKLADKNFISMAVDKTNYQYVREITNQNYQHEFAALTLNYEYVWYGEFAIEENIYRRMETGFSQFNGKL